MGYTAIARTMRRLADAVERIESKLDRIIPTVAPQGARDSREVDHERHKAIQRKSAEVVHEFSEAQEGRYPADRCLNCRHKKWSHRDNHCTKRCSCTAFLQPKGSRLMRPLKDEDI